MVHNSLRFLVRDWNSERIQDLGMIYKATDIYPRCSLLKFTTQLQKYWKLENCGSGCKFCVFEYCSKEVLSCNRQILITDPSTLHLRVREL